MVSNSLVGRPTYMHGYCLCISEQSRSTISGFPSNSANKSINSPYVESSRPTNIHNYVNNKLMMLTSNLLKALNYKLHAN